MADTRQINEHAHESDPLTNLRRRGLVAGAAALVAGILAQRTATTVQAAHQAEDLGLSLRNPATGTTLGVTTLEASVTGNPGFFVRNNFGAAQDVYQDGIQGYAATANAAGVFGRNNDTNGIGVSGAAPNGLGVFGGSTGGSGVAGNSASGNGVYGQSSSSMGVYGTSTSGYGVVGSSTSGYGVYGTSTSFSGVVGITTAINNAGVFGTTSATGAFGVYGYTGNPSAYAGIFGGAVAITGNVSVNGSFTVVDPANKHGAIAHPDGTHRLLYSMESPESWLEDFGTGAVVNGKADIKLDPDFVAVAQTDDYKVFLTPLGDSKGLYVTNQKSVGFSVREQQGGTSGVSFHWRVVARPKTDKKVQRLAKVDIPKMPPTPTALMRLPAPPALPNRK